MNAILHLRAMSPVVWTRRFSSCGNGIGLP